MNRPRPRKRLATVLAIGLCLALAVAALAGDRNKFPGRRQGGGSRGAFPTELL